MPININRKYCYRICHIDNIGHILDVGLCTKNHTNAAANFIPIGNSEIITTRDNAVIDLDGYGKIGDYVPFYFTPKSIMLLNIITGHRHPVVPKRNKDEIVVIRCLIESLMKLPKWFFTDGQANDKMTTPYNDITQIEKVDWDSIINSNFSKSDGDFDRARRYQSEFLVHSLVPLSFIESFVVFNDEAAYILRQKATEKNVDIAVTVNPKYFF